MPRVKSIVIIDLSLYYADGSQVTDNIVTSEPRQARKGATVTSLLYVLNDLAAA